MAIPVGDAPFVFALKDTSLYVGNFTSNNVTVIDTTTNTVLIPSITVGTNPAGMAISGQKLYVSNSGVNTVSVINTVTNIVVNTIIVGSQPVGLAVDQLNNTLYVANFGANTLSLVNTLTDTIIGLPIPVPGANPYSLVLSGNTLYVSTSGDDSVRPMNILTNVFGPLIAVGDNPRSMFLNTPTASLYVGNLGTFTVTVIDINTNTVSNTLGVGSGPSAFAKFGDTLYVANSGSNNLALIDTLTNIVTGPIPTGSQPTALAVRNDTATLYIANAGDNNVTFLRIAVPCLHPSTQVKTENGLVPICAIKAGDTVLDVNDRKVKVIHNMQFLGAKEFVIIRRNSFGKDIPSKDLIIKESHPILYRGREVKPQNLVKKIKGVQNIKIDETNVWSLCTKERTFIMMQGVPVCTWAKSDVDSPNFKYKIVKMY